MMQEGTRTTGAARLLWPLVLGLGLALGLLWGLMPHPAAEAQAVNPGFTVDLFHGKVWGVVGPGEMVTVTGPGGIYGAAQADATGFFWTPLWDSAAGTVAEIDDGDVIDFYVESTLDASITARDVTGQVDVLNDRVTGHVPGVPAGTAVTVTLKDWSGGEPPPGALQATATTNSSGNFVADFSGSVNIGPGYWATVDYAAGSAVRDHLAPAGTLLVDSFRTVDGYAQPGQAVSVDIYTGTTTLAETLTGKADKEGYYYVVANVSLDPGDLVEVNLGGGTVISTVVAGLSIHVDADADVVTGTAPAGESVRVFFWRWEDDEQHYYEVNTTATGGVYTADFGGLVDLPRAPWVSAAVSDAEGDETILWSGDTFISVNATWDDAWARVDAGGVPVTATLDTGTGIYTWNGTSHPQYCYVGGIQFDDGMGGRVDIDAGHVVTVESPTWSDSTTVADVTLGFDLENDQVTGDAPTGRAEIEIGQRNSGRYPLNGSTVQTLTLASPFDVTFPDFDLRFGGWIDFRHFNTDGYATVAHPDLPFVQVDLPWGVGGSVFVPAEGVTATLYYSDGVTVKAQTSDDRNDDPAWYWLDDWGDERIEPGDWVTVTGASGWAGGVQVVDLTVTVDEATDRMSGQAPVGLLSAHWDDWPQHSGQDEFVPTDESGSYVIDWSAYGIDVQPGQNLRPYYIALNGNQVGQNFRWPEMRVNYGHNWVGADYPAGHTFWITVTDSGGTDKATATMNTVPGGGWGGDGFQTEWDDWSPDQPDIEPGDWAYFQADDGYSNAIHVGTITGAVDVDDDSVGGNVYAIWFTQTLDVECHAWGAPGGAPSKDSTAAPDGSVPYFCQWDPATEWDILPGQDVAVMYREPDDGDRVINVFEEPAPDLRVGKWSDGQPAAGSNFAYWIEYENDGDVDATDAVLTDTLPLGTSYVADSSGFPANVNGRAITWSLGTVSADSEARFLLVVAVDSGASGTLHNEASIHTLYDSDPWNNSAASDDDVQPVDVDLEVDKWNDSDRPAPGYDFTYKIAYRNHGSTDSGVVALTDTLPLSTTFVSWHAYDPLWNLVGVVGNQAVFTRPVIPGDSGDELYLTLHLSDTVREGTTLTNEVEIATTNETGSLGDNTHTHTMEAKDPHLEIGVDKEFNEGTTVADHDITYRIHYRNHGNVPAYGVAITDTLPSGTTFVTSTIEVWQNGDWRDVPFPPTHTTSSHVVWDVGTLDPAEDGEIRITLHIDPGVAVSTVLTNTVDIAPTMIVTYTDDYLPNNHAEASVAVRAPGPNLMIVKRADWRGGPPWQIEYDFDYYNVGTIRINGFTITDTYPLSTTFNQGDVWWGDPITFTNNYTDNQAIWQVGNSIRPGDSGGGRMTVDVDPAVGRGRIFTNVLKVTIPPGDVHPADNTYVDVQTTGPDLYVVKTGPALWEEPGEVLTFTLRYGNQARRGEDHTDWGGTVYVADTLPAGMAYVTSTQRWCGGPQCPYITPDTVGGSLVFDVGPQGDSQWNEIYLTVRITDTVQPGHVFTNSAAIASSNPTLDVEPYYSNNVDTATVNPSCIPLSSVDFDYAPLKPVIQSPVVFTATYLPLDATLPITYAWNFGDGGTGTGATTSHTYTVSGTLTVRVTAYNPCTPPGVSATPKDIEVAPLRIFLPVVMRNG